MTPSSPRHWFVSVHRTDRRASLPALNRVSLICPPTEQCSSEDRMMLNVAVKHAAKHKQPEAGATQEATDKAMGTTRIGGTRTQA